MDSTDWFLMVLTFFTGVFIGAFIFVTSFKPVYAPEELDGREDDALAFSVSGKPYGGMRADFIHPSFRILKDGSFTYRGSSVVGEAVDVTDGHLPRSLTRSIVAAVSSAPLQAYAAPAASKDCRIAVDGVDYNYQITLAGTVHQLDTCQTNLPYDSDLASTLEMVWGYFEDPRSYTEKSKGTPYNQLEDFLKDQLSPFEEE